MWWPIDTLVGLSKQRSRFLILTAFYLLIGNSELQAQPSSLGYHRVDSIALEYPRRPLRIKSITNRVNRDFSTPEERARALFTWVATCVAYDVKQLTKKDRKKGKRGSPKQLDRYYNRLALKAFWKRKAVCEGYSRLYRKMALQCGLECVVLSGESKTRTRKIGNERFVSSHAWNAVKIDGEWKLLDATWGAGGVGTAKSVHSEKKNIFGKKKVEFEFRFSDIYFFTDPELFSLNHYPEDSNFVLCDRSYADFTKLPLCLTYMIENGSAITDSTYGVIRANYGDTFSIYLKDQYELKDLEFKFGRERWDHRALQAYANEDGGHTFDFVNPSVNGDYLWVYWNDYPIIIFRIRPKLY